MQAAKAHIMFIHKNGWDKYISEMNQAEDEEKNEKSAIIFSTSNLAHFLLCGPSWAQLF